MPSTKISNDNDSLDITVRDLRLRYQNCIFLIKDTNTVGYLQGVNTSEETVYLAYEDVMDETGFIRCIPYDKCNIDFRIPKLGFFNTSAIYAQRVYRLSKRSSSYKYIRGLNAGVVEVERYSPRDACIKSEYSCSFNTLAYNIYNPVYYSQTDAIEAILSFEKMSVALSRDFAISVDIELNRIFLYYANVKIGVYVRTLKVFRLFTDIFNEDLNHLDIKYFNKENIEQGQFPYEINCRINWKFWNPIWCKNVRGS